MSETQILEPFPADETDIKIHSDNYTRIKSFLGTFKPDNEHLNMADFLAQLNPNHDHESYILAVRSSLETSTILLKRLPSEVRVNNYNLHCLTAGRANMDIQFILNVYA
jgi:hypothetical protein